MSTFAAGTKLSRWRSIARGPHCTDRCGSGHLMRRLEYIVADLRHVSAGGAQLGGLAAERCIPARSAAQYPLNPRDPGGRRRQV